MNTQKLALVAGEGSLPLEILHAIKASGQPLPKVYLLGADDAPYRKNGFAVRKISNPMAIAMILTQMRLMGIKRLMMAGRVSKSSIYSKEKLDEGAKSILANVYDRNDHTLLAGVVKYVEKFGIDVVSYADVIPEMFAADGHIAGPTPTQDQLEDCDYALKILKVLLPLSFGQSVVVSGRAVVAVEAMEGTDETVRRAGRLITRGGVLLKGMRADQDRRYDLPVVGLNTLRVMSEGGLNALFVESGSVLILDRAEFFSEAEKLGIAVYGVSSCQFS